MFSCFNIIIYWLIKNVFAINLDISLLSLLLEDNIPNMFLHFHLQKVIQKVYLLLENLHQLSDLNIDFVLFLDLIDICFNCSFNLIVEAVLHYLELIKLLLEHKSFVSVIENLPAPGQLVITQVYDHVDVN